MEIILESQSFWFGFISALVGGLIGGLFIVFITNKLNK